MQVEMNNSRKNDVRYLFMVRRIADFDHLVPIGALLLDNGVPATKIRYRVITPHLSMIGIGADPRAIYLESRGIILETTFPWLFQENELKKKLGTRYQRCCNYMGDRIKNFCWGKMGLWLISAALLLSNLIAVVWASRQRGLLLMDHCTMIPYKVIARFAQMYRVTVIGCPSGVTLCYSMAKTQQTVLPELVSVFDKVIIQNDIEYSPRQFSGRTVVFGSLRYSLWWINNLKTIIPKKYERTTALTILYLLDKESKEDRQSIIDLICQFANGCKSDILIKGHPRSPKQRLSMVTQFTNLQLISSDKEHTSFDLIRNADVVVATGTASIVDAFVLGKPVLIPTHHSSRELIWTKSGLPGCVSTDAGALQFLEVVRRNRSKEIDSITSNTYDRLIHEYIMAKTNPKEKFKNLLI